MKKVFITLLCLSVSAAAVKAQDNKTATATPAAATPAATPATPPPPDPNAGKFRFEEETHDYGEVEEGPIVECDFEFKNVGKSPIIISECHGSCGCTVPKWPKDPILPKHKGVIHVSYNTKGRIGPISKDVFITSNAQTPLTRVHIKGYVKGRSTEPTKPAPAVPPAPPAAVH